MADYIERNAALDAVMDVINDPNCPTFIATTIEQVLTEVPSAKVRENVHGMWVFDDNWWDYVCTNCRGRIGNIKKYKFCPHCGARMKE